MSVARDKSDRFFVRGAIALVLVVGIAIAIALAAMPRLQSYFLTQTGQQQQATLTLAVEGLRGTLERFAPIPNLIADRPEIKAALGNPGHPILLSQANQLLEQTAVALRADGVYLEDGRGRLIAASNPEDRQSANGSRGGFRPYFEQAVGGGLGQYFALGTGTGDGGFFYAAPVRASSRINGVVSVRFSVNQFENTWRGTGSEITVRDPNDIVFMSSRPDWKLRSMVELPDEVVERIRDAQQFPIDQIELLSNQSQPLADQLELITIETNGARERFVSSTALIARAGWRVSILTPIGPAVARANTVALLTILALSVIALLIAIFWQRRQQFRQRLADQERANEMLETRVAERTAELADTNVRLREEIGERVDAEARLRKTQTDLIQAGKLAALGQMSAALSHEMNQPLAAVKSYAENALAFLKRGDNEDVSGNLKQISEMTDRMSSISRHLRNFARRPKEKTEPVDIERPLDDALAVMQPRLDKSDARLTVKKPPETVMVMGGHVRLQQVMVNLISNALDASDNQDKPVIDIRIETSGDDVQICVRDRGLGLDEDTLKSAFDPFYTTKGPGHGLGLGLSISYNIVRDFGGTLSAANSEDGGAVFTISLKRALAHEDISRAVEAAQ